jgi:hypothetical protein
MDEILQVVNAITPFLLAVGGWLLAGMRDNIKTISIANNQRMTSNEADIKDVRDKLTNFMSSIPQTYVMRDDYIRTIAGFDTKMDNLTREVGSISKKMSRLCADRNLEEN